MRDQNIIDTGKTVISHPLRMGTRGVTLMMHTPGDPSEIFRRVLSVNAVAMKATHHVPASLTLRRPPDIKIGPAQEQRVSSSVTSFSVIRLQRQPHQALPSTGSTLHLRELFQDTSTHMLQTTLGEGATAEAVQEADQAVEGVVPSDKDPTVAQACIDPTTAGQAQERRLLSDTHRCQRNTFRLGGCQFMSDDPSYEIFLLTCSQDIHNLSIISSLPSPSRQNHALLFSHGGFMCVSQMCRAGCPRQVYGGWLLTFLSALVSLCVDNYGLHINLHI